MKVEAAPKVKEANFFRRALLTYQTQTGQSPALWLMLALLSFLVQIIFRREMKPGEFGSLNTGLGLIGLLTVPMLAVDQAITLYLARPHGAEHQARLDSLRKAAFLVKETFAWLWGGLCILLALLFLSLLDLPRFSLQLFTLMNVLVAVGSLVSGAACERDNRFHRWVFLIAAAAVVRVLVGASLAWKEPWAESGLAAFLAAGLITLAPALHSRDISLVARLAGCGAIMDRDFLRWLGATFSVLLALFLFSSADRIVAQSWFGVVTDNNMGWVNWPVFDSYQTAGLLARALLWGTQPLLWILFAQRSRLNRTTTESLTFFWIYLGVLLVGAIILGFLSRPLSQLFCGDDYQTTAALVPSLSAAMIPLGLLQGLGIFSLASRRYPECFTLGACGIGYALLLYLAGRQPQLMPVYMFGGALVASMVVLFVGVVRWGRKQP